MVSVKAVTLSWEMLMLEGDISRKCELKRDLQREYFPNVKLVVVSDVQRHRTEVQPGKQVGSKMRMEMR